MMGVLMQTHPVGAHPLPCAIPWSVISESSLVYSREESPSAVRILYVAVWKVRNSEVTVDLGAPIRRIDNIDTLWATLS